MLAALFALLALAALLVLVTRSALTGAPTRRARASGLDTDVQFPETLCAVVIRPSGARRVTE